MTGADRDDAEEETELFSADLADSSRSMARTTRAPCLIVLSGTDVGRIYALDGEESIIGRAPGLKVRLGDHSLSRHHARIRRVGPEFVIEDLSSSNGTAVNDAIVENATLSDGDRIQLGQSCVLIFTFRETDTGRFEHNLVQAAEHDALTGAYTRQYLLERLALELAYARRHARPLPLVRIAIVGQVAAELSEADCTRILPRLSRAIQSCLSQDDLLARSDRLAFVAVCRSGSAPDRHALERLLGPIAAPAQISIDIRTPHALAGSSPNELARLIGG